MAVCLAAHSPAQAQPSPSAEIDRSTAVSLSGSVLRVEASKPTGGFSMGSGVTVGPDLVITNCHVTRESTRLNVVRNGVRWRVTAQVVDAAHDLCLLQAPGLQSPAVAMADANAVQLGQSVLALGYTGGMGLQHSLGLVVGLHRQDNSRVVQTSNGFNSGASGGGLFDNQGRLLGILTFRLRGAEQHYFAAPANWVASLVLAAQAGALQAVQTLDTADPPFWLAQGDQQPRFLRASMLQVEQRWLDLAGLARAWLLDDARDDARDGEPWYLLGMALDQLAQPAQARMALHCALRLQPQRETAQARLDKLDKLVPESSAGLAAQRLPETGTVAAVSCPAVA